MKKTYLILALALAFASCTKKDVPEPDFNVTTAKTTYKVGENITFDFTGDAELITFYSGIPGKEYEFRDRFTVDGEPQMTFTSTRSVSNQDNTMLVMASTNFSGVFNPENVQAAKWTDLTPRATMSTGGANTPSGVISLKDFVKGDSSVYIAFRYTGRKDPLVPQPTWLINSLTVTNKIADGTQIPVTTMATIIWGQVNILNIPKSWASANTTQLLYTTSPANSDDNDDWLISQPLQLNRVQRSTGLNVRSSQIQKETSYLMSGGYATAGTYTATFEVANSNRWDQKTVVKQIQLTITN